MFISKKCSKICYGFISAILMVVLLSVCGEVTAAESKNVKKTDFGGWEITDAYSVGPTMTESGDIFPTMEICFSFKKESDTETVSYIEVYRATSKKGKYKCIGTIENTNSLYFYFEDINIEPMKKYYYYGIAYWKDSKDGSTYYSSKSLVKEGMYGLSMPHFYTQSGLLDGACQL